MKVNQSGRSMIEMLGVLAIIGVLSIGGIAGYSKAMAKYRTNKMVDQISQIITNIRTAYTDQASFIHLDNELAIDMGAVPADLLVENLANNAAGKLRNVFGGRVFIEASSTSGAGEDDEILKDAFVITTYNIPREACMAIATGDWGAGSSSGLLAMHVYSRMNAKADPTSVDEVMDGITKYDTGTIQQGSAIAVPGDEKVKVPLNVDQARTACYCPNKSICAVSWKFY